MRTDEKRVELIKERTRQIKNESEKKRRIIYDAAAVAASLVLIVAAGLILPRIAPEMPSGAPKEFSGTASIIASNISLGYILMGILAFFLGMSVTVLMYKFKDRRNRNSAEDKRDEL